MRATSMVSFIKYVLSFALVLLSVTGCQNADRAEPADLVLTNAYVYTVDDARSIAEAVAIRGNEIVFVGSGEGADKFVGERTEVRDMGGSMLMPGIHDMHIHALGTVEPDMCDLGSNSYSLEALVPVLKQCIVDFEVADGDWLIALQWTFSSGNEPSDDLPHIRAALDAVSTEHPIFLYGDDGHHGAANSLALSMAINEEGENVAINAASLQSDYAFFRPMFNVDAAGEPTGGVNEDARNLIRGNWYADMLGLNGDLDETLSRVAPKMAANGITSLQDAIVTPESLAAYGRLEKSGGITFRFRAAMFEPPTESIDEIDAHLDMLKTLRDEYAGYEYVSADGVKLFADAVLEGNPLTAPPTLPVAALLNPFKQPIFDGSIDDGSFDVVGYVDPARETCQSVQADPETYMES